MTAFSRTFAVAVLGSAVLSGAFATSTSAAVSLIGVQYQQDDWFPEFNCIWKDKYYPNSCPVGTAVGCNVHAYLKNNGSSPVTVGKVFLENYELGLVIKLNTNVHDARSIYFYWDNPPQDILNAGEPVWYKVDPSTAIPAGGVAQVVVRLRFVPVTNPVHLRIETSGGNVDAAVTADANAPQLASVGFSQDRKKVYLHWRRNGGAAPNEIWMDGVDVTANAVTVGDPSVNYAETVLTFPAALSKMSYHVYQGIYSDSKTATASVRTWANKFMHGTYNTFDLDANYTIADWIAESSDHGINNCQVSVGNVVSYMNTAAGAADCLARGYGYTTGDKTKFDTRGNGPDMFFINDEIDAEESNMENTFCGTGLKLPCGKSPMGILAMRSIAEGEALRAIRPLTPTSINMDGSFKPENYYAYGQAVDILQVDPYYQRRLQDAYWRDQNVIPVYEKATYIYAVAKAVARAAEPNPSNVILYSCSWKCEDSTKCDEEFVNDIWPFADPETKRMEAYYALAAGAKGLCYWWLNSTGWPAHGLADQSTQAARDLWREIGLYGNEIKTLAPQLVTSYPVDMVLAPSQNVWARALASGTDTLILLAVNDDYYNDTAGFHHTPVASASVVATLPSWMRASPTAFEVRASGLYDVPTSLAGNQLTVSLGTLDITRMIVISTNAALRSQVQSRYVSEVWPGVCAFAPDQCFPQTSPPSIVENPTGQTVSSGGSVTFSVLANGSAPLAYRWQKNNVDLADGGHYSGATTAMLMISNCDSGDGGNYRCVVTNAYGTATSSPASLTVNLPTGPIITQQPVSRAVAPGGTAAFTVVAGGTGTLSYQWQKNQANLADGGHYSGATTATLLISSADSNDAATYRCVISDDIGTATSDEVSLTVAACPAPVLRNGNFEAASTGGVAPNWTAYSRPTVPSYINYTVQTAVPPEGLQYQQIQSSYVATGGAGVYQVVTGCVSGSTYRIRGLFRTNSTSGRATVKCAPNGSTSYSSAIDLTPPTSTTSSTWSNFEGTVTASASSITIFLDGQTHVSVTGDGKVAAFDAITVDLVGCTPPTAPSITQQPVAQNVCPGRSASFTVAATGTMPLLYQWQKDQVNLADAGSCSGTNTATMTIDPADAADQGSYRCVVSNAGGSAYSDPSPLTVYAFAAPDLDHDCDVDLLDFDLFIGCSLGPLVAPDPDCQTSDFDGDNDVDQSDFSILQRCYSGVGNWTDPSCAN